MKKLWVSVDVEPDIAPSESYSGLIQGIPRLLDLFAAASIVADFFVLGHVTGRFSETIRQIAARGHALGSHGHHHEYLAPKSAEEQSKDIGASVEAITLASGQTVSMFRAPNFSANGTTVRILERRGIRCDSSVLPGRVARKWRLFRVYDHRLAPRGPYRPSREDIDVPGQSDVWELPVTENPLKPGTPLGLGFLNSHTVEETIHAAEMSEGDYIAFLIHPWEAVDLPVRERRLPRWLGTACQSDLRSLEEFLRTGKERWGTTTAVDLLSGTRGQ